MPNKDTLQGQWKQFVGRVKEKWGRLTDDDLAQISGRRDILVGKIQEKYGIAKERAEREVKSFEELLESEHTAMSGSSRSQTSRTTNPQTTPKTENPRNVNRKQF